jgi:hypothetical protein
MPKRQTDERDPRGVSYAHYHLDRLVLKVERIWPDSRAEIIAFVKNQEAKSRSHTMIFDQSFDLERIPQLMREASRIASLGLWRRRAEVLLEQESVHIFLKEYFDRKFAIERNFDKVRRYHKATGRYPNLNAGNYELFSFLAILYLTYAQLSEHARKRLKASIRDGLTDDKGLAPVASELRTASNLMGQGFDVDFTDLEGSARYDFLVSTGELAVEVDCKAPSGDVGRQIHERRFLRFASDLKPDLHDLAATGGGHLVHVTIPRNFRGDTAFEGRLVGQTREAIRSVAIGEQSDQEIEISIKPFDLTKIHSGPRGPSRDDLSRLLENSFGLRNMNAVSIWQPARGMSVLVMESRRADRMMDGIYKQLKSSAELQFTGNRPAFLCAQLRAVTAPELRELGQNPRNGLGAIATRLFSGEKRRHLAGVSFVTTSQELTISRRMLPGTLRTSHVDVGAAYVFGNPRHEAGKEVGEIFSKPKFASP